MNLESNKSGPETGSSQQQEEGGFSKRSGSVGNGKGISSSSRACASCKYQRRRCAPGCPLAPYFPAENPQQFTNAHKLFGVRNLAKVLKNMKPPQRDMAIKSMIYQANARANDRVGGCYRIVQELMKQIELCEAELDIVLQQLALYRAEATENEIQGFDTTSSTGIGTSNNTNITTTGCVNGENGNGDGISVDVVLNFNNSIQVSSSSGFHFNSHRHHQNASVNLEDLPGLLFLCVLIIDDDLILK
ncbi:hypothetical protein M9H77_19557 [Catharanthus roseus]|uniref:Uncharacterized protein n=1 Tax=Catharanthus roseus TaxID=4058 RepID=A0ACC0BAM5_CATRO|nr:hypothetical protein M9H77_19557 [Catharanthus roseus]